MIKLPTSLLIAALWLFAIHSNATIRYVTPTGSGTGLGTPDWFNASNNLQAMINASAPGDEVWVAAGTYKPTAWPTGCSGCSTNRDFTFYVKDGVKIYGGFAAIETKLNQRHIAANPSILSGDFNNDDIVTGNGNTLSILFNGENAYHVLLASTNDTTGMGVTIDGFIIRGGNANDNTYGSITVNGNSVIHNSGGGIFTVNGINKLINNTLSGNSAVERGGSIFTYKGINTLSNNTLSGNWAGSRGGGIYTEYGSNTLTNNTLSGNSATNGGGVSTFAGTNMLTNNTLSDNSASNNGGGIFTYYGINILINHILSDNSAPDGGGIYIFNGTNTLTNNTLSGNFATNGGGIYIHSGTNTFTNNVLSGNSATIGGGIYTYYSTNTLINNTIIGNSATNEAGGIYTSIGTNILTNNLFWGNLKGGSITIAGADYYASVLSFNSNTFQYNILQLGADNYPANASKPYGIGASAIGNLFAQDPLFVNPLDPNGADDLWFTADDGLTLQSNSPAINTGLLTGAPLTDITGFTRIGNPDLGAYEYNPAIFIDHLTNPIGSLLTAYPNPFTQSATLAFTLPETTEAELKVYGIDGREVARLFNGVAEAGQLYTVEFDGSGLAAGIYIVSLTGATEVQQRYRLVLAD